jgi:putative SOS response-associated peptidase YedK
MCNLYSQRKPREELRGLFKISGNRIGEIKDQPAIFPRGLAPVIRKAADGDLEVVEMTWGFIRKQPGYAPKPVTNFRDDKALTSPFWRTAVQKRRCLVPATSFCEPAEVTPATWHWFALKGDDPRPLFAFAGIWQPYEGPLNGRDQKERRHTQGEHVLVPDDGAERTRRNHQPRAHGRHPHKARGVRSVAEWRSR